MLTAFWQLGLFFAWTALWIRLDLWLRWSFRHLTTLQKSYRNPINSLRQKTLSFRIFVWKHFCARLPYKWRKKRCEAAMRSSPTHQILFQRKPSLELSRTVNRNRLLLHSFSVRVWHRFQDIFGWWKRESEKLPRRHAVLLTYILEINTKKKKKANLMRFITFVSPSSLSYVTAMPRLWVERAI